MKGGRPRSRLAGRRGTMATTGTAMVPVTVVPATSRQLVGGIPPEALDEKIRDALGVVDTYLQSRQRWAPQIERALAQASELIATCQVAKRTKEPAATAFECIDQADRLTRVMQRMQQAHLDAVRAMDTVTRLRAYLATEERAQEGDDLKDLSDAELRALVQRTLGEP